MTNILAVFIILHGLVHLWYVIMSLQLVDNKPEMGWTGKSCLLTNKLGEGANRIIASILYSFAALGFVVSGVGLLMEQLWFRPLMAGSAVLSLLAIVLFWDGKTSQIIEKGLLGFVISALVLIGLLVF